jgi:hypothetical protein
VPSPRALPGRPRGGGRLARGPALAAALAARLTARDRWLLRMLLEHRVLTTGQITGLAFGTSRACTARMSVLYQLRAVDRFRPLTPAGSSPLHFILDEAGAAVIAAEDGVTAGELGYRRDRAAAIALSPRLAHDTGANGVFAALAAAARASGGQLALESWWGERRCAATWGEHARPDGYGRWTERAPGRAAAAADFFLEYDTGAEDLPRLIAKLAGYHRLAARTGITTPVLFRLPTARREAALRARLAGPPPHGTPGPAADRIPGVPVATTAPDASPDGPAGAAWLPAGRPGPRLRLAALAPPGAPPPAAAPGQAPARAPAGGLPWHPPAPAPPAWDAAADGPRPPPS